MSRLYVKLRSKVISKTEPVPIAFPFGILRFTINFILTRPSNKVTMSTPIEKTGVTINKLLLTEDYSKLYKVTSHFNLICPSIVLSFCSSIVLSFCCSVVLLFCCSVVLSFCRSVVLLCFPANSRSVITTNREVDSN